MTAACFSLKFNNTGRKIKALRATVPSEDWTVLLEKYNDYWHGTSIYYFVWFVYSWLLKILEILPTKLKVNKNYSKFSFHSPAF